MKKDLAYIILTVLVALITIVSFAGTYIKAMGSIETKLINIETELLKVRETMELRDDEIKDINERLTAIETEHKLYFNN